jgi:hypothetical protein
MFTGIKERGKLLLVLLFSAACLLNACGGGGGGGPTPADIKDMQGLWEGSFNTYVYGDQQSGFSLTQDGENLAGEFAFTYTSNETHTTVASDPTDEVDGTFKNSKSILYARYTISDSEYFEFVFDGTVANNKYSGDVKIYTHEGELEGAGGKFSLEKISNNPDDQISFLHDNPLPDNNESLIGDWIVAPTTSQVTDILCYGQFISLKNDGSGSFAIIEYDKILNPVYGWSIPGCTSPLSCPLLRPINWSFSQGELNISGQASVQFPVNANDVKKIQVKGAGGTINTIRVIKTTTSLGIKAAFFECLPETFFKSVPEPRELVQIVNELHAQ